MKELVSRQQKLQTFIIYFYFQMFTRQQFLDFNPTGTQHHPHMSHPPENPNTSASRRPWCFLAHERRHSFDLVLVFSFCLKILFEFSWRVHTVGQPSLTYGIEIDKPVVSEVEIGCAMPAKSHPLVMVNHSLFAVRR